MKEHNMNDLFEAVKKAPTELSEQQVMEMITVIPTLPPPGSSWFNINLNSIIMTTTIATVVSSVLIYFSTTQNTQAVSELPGQEPAQTEQVLTEADSTIPVESTKRKALPEPLDKSSKEVQASTTDEIVKEKVKTLDREAGRTENTVFVEKEKHLLPLNKVSSKPLKETSIAREKLSSRKPLVFNTKQSAPTPEKQVAQKTVSENSSRPVVSRSVPKSGKPLTGAQLRRLKRILIKELFDDRIISSRKPLMTVLQFKRSGISVNFKPLDIELSNKYTDILMGFSIEPGRDKRLIVDADFIMVGRFTPSGFEGEAQGKSMKISFRDTTVTFRELDQGGNGIFGKLTFRPSSPAFMNSIFSNGDQQDEIDIDKGKVRMETMGSVKDAERNTRVASLLTNAPNKDVLRNQGMYLITNPVIIHDNDSGKDPVRIENIARFRKALYRMLLQDAEIDTKKEDVNMEISPDRFRVNDNADFDAAMKQRYTEFFKLYGFGPRETLRVLLCEDFIFIGEFGSENFSGTVEGTLTRDSIRGSIFEELLTRYPMFTSDN